MTLLNRAPRGEFLPSHVDPIRLLSGPRGHIRAAPGEPKTTRHFTSRSPTVLAKRTMFNGVAMDKPAALVVFLLLGVDLQPSAQRDPTPSPSDCGRHTVVVNLQAMTIGGVLIDRPIAEVQRDVGSRQIRQVTELLEGNPSTAWDIEFCGHRARRHWNGISWTDGAFRTIEGLGVGSRLSAFDAKYGPGEFFESESAGFQYGHPSGTVINVEVNDQCYKDQVHGFSVRGNRCVVTSVFIVLRPIQEQ
jgi:hypothetical protein